MAKETIGISVKKEADFSEWYNEIILKGELAEHSSVKGCMVIKPSGYAIWENIQKYFDARIKSHGVKNAYFPLFIPESFFKKEAEHAEGFSPEVAWISNRDEGSERVAVRPTSETVMYDAYSRWIRSWRDLPLRINQWCNVVRWETKATKLFIRTREFLWQEGHCVYETKEQSDEETLLFLKEYSIMAKDILAMPVIMGKKTDSEKFAGAAYTTSIEALMPDGKSIQAGTSHNLGQNFGKAFGISFLGKDEQKQIPFQTSWGVSTRLIGGVVMTHSDDKGLVLPPKIAPIHAVIVPILFKDSKEKLIDEAHKLKKEVAENGKFIIEVDDREEYTPGWKYNFWEMKGVPLRIELGPRDLDKGEAIVVRRDTSEKRTVKLSDLKKEVEHLLDTMQKDMYDKAKKDLDSRIMDVNAMEDVEKAVEKKMIAKVNWCMDAKCEENIKDKTGAKSMNMPFGLEPKGTCPVCHKDAKAVVYFAKSY